MKTIIATAAIVAAASTFFASAHVLAQTDLTSAKPGQLRETIGQAATVIRTVHYQAELVLDCINNSCSGDFPKPGTNRRLNITRATCALQGPSASTFVYGQMELLKADNSHLLHEYLPVDYSSPGGVHTLNRAVDVQVAVNRHIKVFLAISGNASNGRCKLSGTLDILQ